MCHETVLSFEITLPEDVLCYGSRTKGQLISPWPRWPVVVLLQWETSLGFPTDTCVFWSRLHSCEREIRSCKSSRSSGKSISIKWPRSLYSVDTNHMNQRITPCKCIWKHQTLNIQQRTNVLALNVVRDMMHLFEGDERIIATAILNNPLWVRLDRFPIPFTGVVATRTFVFL